MRLIHHDASYDTIMSVSGNKTGRQFDLMQLDAIDVYKLRQLSPEQLKEWLDYWVCGFRPVRNALSSGEL